MPRTPKFVEDRREQILDAAMRVFAERGFSRATNKDIAREAGITPGLIYHYFESKEALLKAIIEARSPLGLVRSLPSEVFEQPPEIFIRFLIIQVLSLVESENFVQLIRVLLPEILHNPNITPIGFNALQQTVSIVESYFTRQMESGILRQAEPRLATQVMIGSVMGFVLRRQIIQDPLVAGYTQNEIAQTITDTVLRGLQPR